jgi:hypothetical protein
MTVECGTVVDDGRGDDRFSVGERAGGGADRRWLEFWCGSACGAGSAAGGTFDGVTG